MRASSCCGCWSVTTGVSIIAYWTIICGLFTIVMTTVYSTPDLDVLIRSTVQIICAIMLIIGVQRRESKFVFPILCVFFTNLIVDIPIAVARFIKTCMLGTQPLNFYIVNFVIIVICFPLLVHFSIVIYTFYKKLLHEKSAEAKMERDFDVHLSN